MINVDADDDEIKNYILENEGKDVEIYGRSMYRGRLLLLVSWHQEVYLDEINHLISSMTRDNQEIIGQYINRQTTRTDRLAKYSMRSIGYHMKKYNVDEQLVDVRFVENRPHDLVQVKVWNVYLISLGCGTFRFIPG